jgi:putative DNA primase/helicase
MSLPAIAGTHAPTYELTDAGNAERFVAQNRYSARYVHGWDSWMLWDAMRWARDERREVTQLGIQTARTLHHVAATASTQDEARTAAKHALMSERRDRIESMLALARALPPIAVTPDDLDRDPDRLNVQNGTIDLRTGRLLPHDRADLNTKVCPVAFNPAAAAPIWEGFIARILADPAVRTYVQLAVGYSLTGHVREHCLFFAHGGGANGKSTFLETLRDLLGEGEYAKAAAPDLLLAKRQDRHAVEIADLRGARFVTTVEVGEGRAWDESRVKWLTGGDAISARLMYGNPFTFHPTHKFWIAGNHKPRVHGTDHGFWRRVHFIPFTVTIPKEEQDPELRAKLRAELPGILRWAVEGCVGWYAAGLRAPPAVLAATQAYRSAEDVLGAFLDECCDLEPSARVLVSALYDVFRLWAERSGERDMTKRAFGDALEERHGIERKASNGQRWFVGVGLKQAAAYRTTGDAQ